MSKKHKNIVIQRDDRQSVWQFKVVEYLAYLLIFLVPLFFNARHFYAFNSPKVLLTISIVLVSLIFYMWGKWKSNEFKIKISLLGISAFVFVATLTISSIFGIDPANSFFGWGNVVPLVAIYALFVFALIIGALAKRNKSIIKNILLSSFVSGIFAVLFFYTGLPDPIGKIEGSTLGNSSYVGGFLIFMTFFGLALFSYFKKVWQKILVALGIIFMTVNPLFINKEFLLGHLGLGDIMLHPTSILGIANGGAMGIVASLVFISILFLVFSKKKIFKIVGLVLMLALLIGVASISQSLVREGTKINKIFAEEKSGNRFIAWDIAKEGYVDHPIIGNGHNNYIYNFEKYYNPDLYKKGYAVERLIEPHNVVWEFASDGGALGLFGYLFLLVSIFISLVYIRNDQGEVEKREKTLRIILAGILFGYFLQNLFVFDTINTYVPLFVLVGIGLGLGEGYTFTFGKDSKYFKILNKSVIVVITIASIFLLKTICYDGAVESKGMNMTNSANSMAEFTKKREGLADKSYFGGIMEYTLQAEKFFKIYQKNMDKVDARNKPVFLKELSSIVSNIEKINEREPEYSGSYLVMSEILNLYLLVDAKEDGFITIDKSKYNKEIWEKSFRYINKAVELNSNNPQNYLVLSQLYMLKGDFDHAFLFSKKYIEIAPEYEEGYRFARSLLRIKPNSAFASFVDQMEKENMQ